MASSHKTQDRVEGGNSQKLTKLKTDQGSLGFIPFTKKSNGKPSQGHSKKYTPHLPRGLPGETAIVEQHRQPIDNSHGMSVTDIDVSMSDEEDKGFDTPLTPGSLSPGIFPMSPMTPLSPMSPPPDESPISSPLLPSSPTKKCHDVKACFDALCSDGQCLWHYVILKNPQCVRWQAGTTKIDLTKGEAQSFGFHYKAKVHVRFFINC